MTRNLATADTIVKLVLSISVVVFYFAEIITGPFAKTLMIIATVVLAIFSARAIITKWFID